MSISRAKGLNLVTRCIQQPLALVDAFRTEDCVSFSPSRKAVT